MKDPNLEKKKVVLWEPLKKEIDTQLNHLLVRLFKVDQHYRRGKKYSNLNTSVTSK